MKVRANVMFWPVSLSGRGEICEQSERKRCLSSGQGRPRYLISCEKEGDKKKRILVPECNLFL